MENLNMKPESRAGDRIYPALALALSLVLIVVSFRFPILLCAVDHLLP